MVAMHCGVSLQGLHKKYWHLTTEKKIISITTGAPIPNQLVLEQTRSHVLSVQGVRRVLSRLQQWLSLFQETASIEEETSESPFCLWLRNMSSAMQSRLNALHMNMFDMDDIMNKHSKTRELKLERFGLENALQDIEWNGDWADWWVPCHVAVLTLDVRSPVWKTALITTQAGPFG